jgi:pyroglutamyl-peptidase
MTMATVLTSGFGPFPGHLENASWSALSAAQPDLPSGWKLRRVHLDVAWSRAADTLLERIDQETQIVLAFGQADDDPIRIERFALNAPDTTLADIDGEFPSSRQICADGPPAYETGLPIAALVEAISAEGAAVTESHYAGGYLCNFTFYRLMHQIATKHKGLVAGFIHVPPANRLDVTTTARAIQRTIETVIEVVGSAK